MPSVITHDAFALRYTPENERQYFAAVRSGSQSTDVFMAYGTNPFHKRADKALYNPWGVKMHHTHLAEVYPSLMEYANRQDPQTKEMLYAYIDGLLMHFCLDTLVHPYVFYRTGFDENGDYGGDFIAYHGFFETLLDMAVGQREGNYQRLDKAMGNLSEAEVLAISKMWAACATMPLKETAFAESYEDYNNVTRYMHSPLGFKRLLLRLFVGKLSKPYSMCAPRSLRKYESLDVLNESHALWLDPVTKEEHHESVFNLFEQAHERYLAGHALLEKAKGGADIREELTVWERNRDHDGTPYGQRKQVYSLCLSAKIM